jgi:hypothetical protein
MERHKEGHVMPYAIFVRTRARLSAARRCWAWEDRQCGWTAYRGTRPAYRRTTIDKRLQDTLLVLGAVVIVTVFAGIAG